MSVNAARQRIRDAVDKAKRDGCTPESFATFMDTVVPDWRKPMSLEDVLVAALLGLDNEERRDIFMNFCWHCGGEAGCVCWNDE